MPKIRFEAVARVCDAEIARNQAENSRAGHPPLRDSPAPLAIVGGAPGIERSRHEIQSWEGEVWAINGAIQWCRANDIDATLFIIDPAPMARWPAGTFDGVERAILADFVNPIVFDLIPDVQIAHLGKGKILHATTAASSAPMLAAHRGHKSIRFFGCNGSFEGATHAYKDERSDSELVWVKCGGEYLTTPQFVMQTEFLAELARGLPDYISVAGGGFLPALIEHGDYGVTHVSPGLHRELQEEDAA